MTEKSTYHHGNLREALMLAATKIIRTDGAEKLSLRALAREVGVSQAAPYRHFQDKVALLSALASDGFERLGSAMRAKSKAYRHDPRRALELVGLEYVSFAVANPEIYRLMFGMKVADFDAGEMQACHTEGYFVLEEVIKAGLDSGIFRPHDADVIAKTAWSLVHGFASLIIDGMVEFNIHEAEAHFQQMASVLFVGVGNQS